MEQLTYHKLSKDIEQAIKEDIAENRKSEYRFKSENAVRRDNSRDKNTVLRPAFIRDIDKILHLPLYNRYNDKTQVFSLYSNDDISRRGFHVQLVSRIARNIGRLLGLDLDLIEAIALGHDLGHTPFGHAGEKSLSELLYSETGRYFNHNVHSVRVLDGLFRRNMTLQTLDGILCHNGELELDCYRPAALGGFDEFDRKTEDCYIKGSEAIAALVPSTLEACVVRISDIIAYIGKDRQDAVTAHIISEDHPFSSELIGSKNAAMINNLVVDIVNNSYGKPFLKMSAPAFEDIKTAKKENYRDIYFSETVSSLYNETIDPMFKEIFYALLDMLKNKDEQSIMYRHHISFVRKNAGYYEDFDYLSEDPAVIAADFIASMTDDYFIELHKYLFPDSKHHIEYISYFDS